MHQNPATVDIHKSPKEESPKRVNKQPYTIEIMVGAMKLVSQILQ